MKVFPAVVLLVTIWSQEWKPLHADSIIHIGKLALTLTPAPPSGNLLKLWTFYKLEATQYASQDIMWSKVLYSICTINCRRPMRSSSFPQGPLSMSSLRHNCLPCTVPLVAKWAWICPYSPFLVPWGNCIAFHKCVMLHLIVKNHIIIVGYITVE